MKRTPAPLGFGIVGAGMIAGFHAEVIAQLNGARMVGVASRNLEGARAFALKHRVPRVMGSVEELVSDPDIQVVCVTTPSGAHLEPSLAALRAGKHVVVEKPLEVTTARVDALLSASLASGKRLAPIFQARFGTGTRRVKAALDAGRLGRLVLASASVKWHRPDSYYTGWKGSLALDGGAVLINQAIHGIDLLQWFAGMPSEVFAWTTRAVHQRIEGEDTAVATLRFPCGAHGIIEASTAVWPGWSRRIELCGACGSICLEDDRITRWDFQQAAAEDDEVRRGLANDAMGSGAGAPHAISTAGHQLQLQDLVEAIASGAPLAIEGAEARKAVSLVNALYLSASTRCPVAPS